MKLIIDIPDRVVNRLDYVDYFGCMSDRFWVILNKAILLKGNYKLINYYDLLDHLGRDKLDSRESLFEMANKLPVIVETDQEGK